MKPQRFQVDIKPNHQPIVKQLMQMLGNVSSADAIGFLIETQISAALARLQPDFSLPQFATGKVQPVERLPKSQQEVRQEATHYRQIPTVSHGAPQDDAANALDALLST
jgi:hypothetical protein